MPKLVIHSVTCNDTTSGWGDDQVFINVNGRRVFGVVDMAEGQTTHPGGEIAFNTRAVIDVWEYDSGSDNDRIGQHTARGWQAGSGEHSVSMSGDCSEYTLTYEVV
jgi:hypothetical protein